MFIFSAYASLAHGQDYNCFAKANPERGFNSDFNILLQPATIGGQMILKVGVKQMPLGTISEVGVLNSSDPALKPAFDATLGLISEVDVSAVAEKDLANISSMQIFKAITASGEEMIVYQLFVGVYQIGGTFMGSGLGTA
jgi:hypothetical protein